MIVQSYSIALPPIGGGLHSVSDTRCVAIAGDVWRVHEDARTGPPSYGPSLIFETELIARRVRHYPADWRALTDDQLYALSWSV
jgi:hypothetical protein